MIWVEQYGGGACRTLTWLRHVDSLGGLCTWRSSARVGTDGTRRPLTGARRRTLGLYCQRNSFKITTRISKGEMTYITVILPVSLANIIGGPWCASAKCRVRGYLVLLNRCRTMQMRPANTAIPVVTPKSVGRSEAMPDKSEEEFTPAKPVILNFHAKWDSIYLVYRKFAVLASNA